METLPIELFSKILYPIINDKNFNIRTFFELQYLSKYFYKMVNSHTVLTDICKIKKIYNKDLKESSYLFIKKHIFNRLYNHNYNFGYNWLPNYMRFNHVDIDEFNQNNTLTTNFQGSFEKILIRDKENNVVLDLSNDKITLNHLKIIIERHELFHNVYSIYFKVNNNDNENSLAYTNLNDYKVKILGVVY